MYCKSVEKHVNRMMLGMYDKGHTLKKTGTGNVPPPPKKKWQNNVSN